MYALFAILAPDRIAPSVSITSPSNGSVVGGTISFSASASDNRGVLGVQFKLDGSNYGSEDTVAPYTISVDTHTLTNGGHTLQAVARDLLGNVTTTSVTFTVSNSVPATGYVAIGDYSDGSRYFVGGRDDGDGQWVSIFAPGVNHMQDIQTAQTIPANPDITHYQQHLSIYVGAAEINVGENHKVGIWVNGGEQPGLRWVNPSGVNNQGNYDSNGGESVLAKRWTTTSDNNYTAWTHDVRVYYSYTIKGGYVS